MADRSVTLTNTRVDLSGAPIPYQLISIAINLPAGLTTAPTDSISGDTIDTTTLSLRTNSSGVWTQAVVAPGDIVPAGCTYTITEGTQETESPAFAYTGSPITVSSWYNTVSLVGRILMYVTAEQISTAPAAGKPVRITLNNTSIWSSGGGAGQLIYGNTPLPYSLNAAGTLAVALIPNASLTPSIGGCTLTTAQNFQIVFNVPSAYTGAAGVWSNTTTYATGAVVTDPTTGIPYTSLANGNVGNALSNATWWALYGGESITANQSAVSPPTSLPITPTNILADTSVATGTYANPPATLQDQLRQLTQIQARHVTASTDSATYDDDVLDLDGTSNAVTETLPDAITWTKFLLLKCINVTHVVTINPHSGQTIDGASTLVPALNIGYLLYSNGSNWQIGATANLGGMTNPMTTLDDLIVGGASGVAGRLAKGTSGQVLTIDPTSGHVAWETAPTTAFSFVAKTANYTITTADSGIAADATSGALTMTLPTAVGATQLYAIKKIDASAHTVTLGTTSSQTIDGASTVVLTALDQEIVVGSNGSAWLIQGGYTPNPLTALGDLLIGGASGAPGRLAIGSTGQVPTVAGGTLVYATPIIHEPVVLSVTSGTADLVTLGQDIVVL